MRISNQIKVKLKEKNNNTYYNKYNYYNNKPNLT